MGKWVRDTIATIPFLLIFLPGRVRSLKLDHILCYALGISIWAVRNILFFQGRDRLFRDDECLTMEET